MVTGTLDITEARTKFTTLDTTLRDSPVIWITRHNKRAFAVVGHELMEALLETLEVLNDPDSMRLLQQSIQDIRAGNLIAHDDLKKDMETW